MTTEQISESTINHRVNAAVAAAVEHLRPRLARALDSAARATARAAEPVITDVVRAAAPPLQAAIRHFAETVGEALADADQRSPARRQQRALEALRASGEAARGDFVQHPMNCFARGQGAFPVREDAKSDRCVVWRVHHRTHD